MPTTSQIGLPLPATFEELENIACDYFSSIYNNPFQKWGKRGQNQYGIDLYGKDSMGRWIGVQCKNYTITEFSSKTIDIDVKKAEQLNPPLAAMIFVTTAPRDVKIQDYVRGYNGQFPIEIYYWDVIESFLLQNPQIKDLHYPKQEDITLTQSFINEFLKLCNKYDIYYAIFEVDYIAPFCDKVFINNDLFYEEVGVLLTSNISIGVDKNVLKDIRDFKENLNYMISNASMRGHSNGCGKSIQRFEDDERKKMEKFYTKMRKSLMEIYNKYKF